MLFFQFSVTGAGAGFFWWARLIAGLQVQQALRCSGYLGWVSSSGPHVPGHPTSICDESLTSVDFFHCYVVNNQSNTYCSLKTT